MCVKIEEAVILVPTMIAEEKLKAVQFWNVVSERLQEIVNNSAADINALAMRLEHEEQQSQPVPLTLQQREKHSPQTSSTQMADTMPSVADNSSDDKQELYLPIIAHSNSHQNVINDNSIISNNSSNHMTTSHEFSQTGVNTTSADADDEEIAEHLASVITSYHETHPNPIQESSQQLFIAFGERHPKESQEVYQQMSSTSATTSVIQEVDQNMLTSQRRNVIQSTQRAIEAIEKNLQNCCNDFENQNKNNFNNNINNSLSDNTCDENISYNSINGNNSNTNHNLINTDESLGESSANNHIFNETSFDVSSYASSEDTEQQKRFRIDETLNDSNISEEKSEEIKVLKKTNSVKKKSKTNGTNDKSKSCDNKSQTNGKTVFECDICHKVLPNNSALVSHQWIHSKPYSCEYDECSARFSTKGNLLVHQV